MKTFLLFLLLCVPLLAQPSGTGLPRNNPTFTGTLTGPNAVFATPLPLSSGGTGATTASAAVDALGGATATGTGGLARATSPVFATDITLPNGTAPTTGSVAKIAFDTNAWATSFGAIQVHDGTANNYVIAALASDTPTNGQVPQWNTGGTITWETPAGGAALTNTYVGYGASSVLSGEAAFVYTAASNILTVGGVSLGAGGEASTIGPLVDSVDGTTPLNNINQVVAAGTAYTMTASYASLDFGTTDPVLTIANAGTYAIYVDVQFNLVGATYATYDSVSIKLRRTNNTAADLTGSTFGTFIPTITTITAVGPYLHVGPIKYVTANTDDTVTVQAILGSTPSVGSVTATAATITAIRAY